MKQPQPSKFAAMILPLLAGGLVLGLLITLLVAAWPALLAQPLAMIDPFWSIGPSGKNIYYGYGGFLLASLFTSVLAVGAVLLLSWFTAIGLRRNSNRQSRRECLVEVLHVLSAIPPVAVGLAVAQWLLPALAQTAGYSGRCYLLAIVVLVGIHWPRLTLAWVEVLKSLSPDLFANARALGANRWHTFRWIVWPAVKHRVAELALQTLTRCLGEAVGILFVCGASGQTAFQFDLFSNTDTLATRLFSGDEVWSGPHRAALFSVAFFLVMLCLALGFISSRLTRQQRPSAIKLPTKMGRLSCGSVFLILIIIASLKLSTPLVMDLSQPVSGIDIAALSGKTVLLLLASALCADLLAGCVLRGARTARSFRMVQAVPPIVWAVGIGAVLPGEWRLEGLFVSLVLLQSLWMTTEFHRSRHQLPCVLMSIAVFLGELSFFVLLLKTPSSPQFLGELIFNRTYGQPWIPVVLLCSLSLVFATISRLMLRIYPSHSASA